MTASSAAIRCRHRTIRLALALPGLLLLRGPAWAGDREVALRQTANPAWPALPNPSVLGIRFGDSPEEVTRIIKALYPDLRLTQVTQRLRIILDGKEVSSAPYLSAIEANTYWQLRQHNVDAILRINVAFALPSTGGGVVGVSMKRDGILVGREENLVPLMSRSAFAAQLMQAYGLPSVNGSIEPDASGDPDMLGLVSMQWLFGSASRLPCRSSCTGGAGEIELKRLSDYEAAAGRGETFHISASGFPFGTDRINIRVISIYMDDVANKALSLNEAVKQLRAAAAAMPSDGGPRTPAPQPAR